MNATKHRAPLDQYRNVGAHGSVANADPHRLIQLMMEAALNEISGARGHMERQEVASKGERISRAIAILDNLRLNLDLERGGDLAARLDTLYDYMGRRLLQANLEDKPVLLEEVAALLREIKTGWDGIRVPPAQSQPVEATT